MVASINSGSYVILQFKIESFIHPNNYDNEENQTPNLFVLMKFDRKTSKDFIAPFKIFLELADIERHRDFREPVTT